MPIATIPEALEAFAKGEFLIVIDNPSRENEGDLIISSAHLTPAKMAFMIRYTSGLICVPMSESRLLELGLPDMVERNEESLKTAYTVSCDAREGVTTGISASDRAHTCNVLSKASSTGLDIVRPGHVFPLRAREGGVLVRDGHTEAAVDLCKLSGLRECAAISEIVRDEDGEMARTEELLRRGQEWGILVITIEDLKDYRRSTESGPLNATKGTEQDTLIPEDTELLSSILYSSCSFFLLDLHLARLRASAQCLGWQVPDEMEITRTLYQSVMGKAHLSLKLRLTMNREGDLSIEVSEMPPKKNLLGPFSKPGQKLHNIHTTNDATPALWTVFVDTEVTQTRTLLPLIRNKTTSRKHYQAPMKRRSASLAKQEEVLLVNENDEITEGTITNIFFWRNDKWVTPPLSCGLLDGVVRQSLLLAGKIEERVIRRQDLKDGERVLICNAVRGVLEATLVL